MNEIDRIERRLKLHDMRVLMSVVQAGSMSKAAERLGTAQPAFRDRLPSWNMHSACAFSIAAPEASNRPPMAAR
jgi:regulatory helix-turn-helix LysR family protein